MANSTKSRAASAPASYAHHRPKRLSTLLMLGATALLLTLMFPPFYCFFLAPIALVPLTLCILRRPMRFSYLAAYFLCGAAFFIPNLFWLAPVTIGGYLALALFVALYFPLAAVGIHRLIIQLRLPATIALPVVWTAVEFLRAVFVLGGFPWFLLGNALAPLPNHLWYLTGVFAQSADLFGVWGLTFFIALINGFVVDLLRLPLRLHGRFNPTLGRLLALVLVVVIFTIAYGTYRINQASTRPGPIVAVLQGNFEQRIKDDPTMAGKVLAAHVELLRMAAESTPRPDLIAWPETMVTTELNDSFIKAPFSAFKDFKWDAASVRMQQQDCLSVRIGLQNLTDLYKTPQLLGYEYFEPRGNFSDSIKQNRTALMLPGGSGEPAQQYSKIHLVPFGEFIPFRGVPIVGNLMLHLSPYGFDYSNTPGTTWTRFTLPVDPSSDHSPLTTDRSFTFATPICFEDAMPEPCRMMSAPQFPDGHKTDFLVNVSNDGWFYGAELDQHIQACQFRAIENRIAIARSVNTGNSGFIDPNGQITLLVRDANGNSLGVTGTATQTVPIDSRITLYSQIGDLLPIVCGILATLLTGWTFLRPRRGR